MTATRGSSRTMTGAGSPGAMPQGNPDPPTLDHSFTLQAVMEMQKTLGVLTEKIDGVSEGQKELKNKVESHDKMIMRAIYSVGGFVAFAIVCWFIYEQFLKDHVKIS